MEDVREWLVSYSPLNDEAWNALRRALRVEEVKKHKAFQKANQPANRLGLLMNGALFARYADESRRYRVAFFNLVSVNRVVCDLEAFAANGNATMSIVAEEPSELLVIDRHQLYRLYDDHKGIERLGRRLAEYSYARAMERIGRMQLKNIDRASDMHGRYKEVFHKFSNRHVAEYLGMSEGELSRAKGRFNGVH